MPLLPEETIRSVAEANDIVEVIGGYVPLKRAGATYRALCPFHREKTPSFHVNPQRQIFRCFGCGKGGGVIRFVMDYENLDFLTSVKKLAERAGIALPETGGPSTGDGAQRELLKKIHAEAAEWFHRSLVKDPAASAARDYLSGRAIGSEIARRWQIGYAPEAWRALHDWLAGRGYSREILLESGLVKTRDDSGSGEAYDRFRDRVMFPIRNESGEVVAFSGRLIKPDAEAPKYVNSPETPIFTKGRLLFGLDRSRREILEARSAILLEGQIDLITCHESGIRNAVAPQGTAFTPEQARLLKRYAEEVVLCLDSDEAGQRAAVRAFPLLAEAGLSVRVALLPSGTDPDSFIRERGPGPFQALINEAPEFIQFFIARLGRLHDLSSGRGRIAAANAAAEIISTAKDPVLREDLVMKASAGLGLSSEAFAKRLRGGGARAATAPPDEGGRGPGHAAAQKPLRPPEPIHILCVLAYHNPDVARWLRATSWREALDRMGADFQPLEIILEAGGGGVALAGLGDAAGRPEIAAYLASLAGIAPPANDMDLAQRWWQEIEIRSAIAGLISKRDRIAASSDPDFSELAALGKQILDLRNALANLPAVLLDRG